MSLPRARHTRLVLAVDVLMALALVALVTGVVAVYAQPLPLTPAPPQTTLLPQVAPLTTKDTP